MYKPNITPTLHRTVYTITSCFVSLIILVAMLVVTAQPVAADINDDRNTPVDYSSFIQVRPPRAIVQPIVHTDIIPPTFTYNKHVGGDIPIQSVIAQVKSVQQGISGKPGVLQTKTDIGEGLTLHRVGNICNDFNPESYWDGTTWTDYFAGWGTFAADDGFYQAKNVTFDMERSVGPGEKYDKNQASMKIASNQPYDAGVMSPAIAVNPGDRVLAKVKYLIYNHDSKGRNFDYASMGIIPQLGYHATYTQGYVRGQWTEMSIEVTATGPEVVIMLQGHSSASLNSNIYFDDVEIYINGVPMRDCRG